MAKPEASGHCGTCNAFFPCIKSEANGNPCKPSHGCKRGNRSFGSCNGLGLTKRQLTVALGCCGLVIAISECAVFSLIDSLQ